MIVEFSLLANSRLRLCENSAEIFVWIGVWLVY